MVDVTTLSTEQLASAQLESIRRLLDAAFDGAFDDTDWEHTLGGHHIVVRSDDEIVAHAAIVPRVIRVADRAFDVGYVEGVATAPNRQRNGLGTVAMQAANEVIAGYHELGVLSTNAPLFYERVGWRRWLGPTSVRQANGEELRTPDEDDGIMILSTTTTRALDLDGPIVCESRQGDDW